jgi:predicted nucleotidyltransferase
MSEHAKTIRLSPAQVETIKATVTRLIGPTSRVWLFGSRTDADTRGGDIDLLVEADTSLPNRAQALCRLEGALVMALGDRKLDILLKDCRTPDAPIFAIARRRGVQL